MNSLSLRQKVRNSSLFDQAAMVFGTQYGKILKKDLIFFKTVFSNRKVKKIFDVGANNGIRSRSFVKLAEYVVAFEPDPSMASIIRYRFSNTSKLKVEELAIGSEVGEGEFRKKKYPGYSTLSEKSSEMSDADGIETIDVFKVKISTIEQMVKKHGLPDYIKIDVEGFELNIFKSLNISVPLISFEANLPQFRNETIEIIDLNSRLNKDLRFNFRIGDESKLALPMNVEKNKLIEIIGLNFCGTIDIFVFNDVVE
jgi:FkbM family methyltransferase